MNIWAVCWVGAILAASVTDGAPEIHLASRTGRIPKDVQALLRLFKELHSWTSSSSSSSSDVTPTSSSSYDGDSRALEDPGSPPPDSEGVAGGHRYSLTEDASLCPDIGDVPYVVQLGEEGSIHCNGVILSPAWVLTTATCTHSRRTGEKIPVQRLTLRAGAARRDTGGAVFRVVRVELHPGFDYATHSYDHDFALLQVRGAGIVFSPTVQAVGLPEHGQRIPGNADTLVSGWGRWSHNKGGGWSDSLQTATVETVPYSDCITAFLAPQVTPRMFCAGGGTPGPCQGDRGATLVLNGTLAGLSSWGYEGCSLTGHPGVYGRVADPDIRDWIRRTTNI